MIRRSLAYLREKRQVKTTYGGHIRIQVVLDLVQYRLTQIQQDLMRSAC